MKILITGGAGFIGSNLSKKLLEDGDEIVCLDNFFTSSEENIKELLKDKKFTFIKHDIIEALPKSLLSLKIDQIYHLASPASPRWYQKEPIYTLRTNFEGTLNVLQFILNCKNKPKILFSSTSEVYGDPEVSPQSEKYMGSVNPHGIRSCYDEGKRVAESLCMNFLREYKLQIKIIRIFNTYGPNMELDDGRVVSNFIGQTLLGKSITIYGEGDQTRSFQYVDDLVEGMISYMALSEDFPGPVNIGNPNEITILELAKIIKKLTNSNSKIIFERLPQDDPKKRCPDISLAKNKFNFSPRVDLKTGLIKTIEYFRERITH
ncbi:SDR family oxidoreductase [Candidatus Peregrinibacteria bacterium]|nr:SDR family oxidoreductase [Candidatus Peregrinibacteria bacterium]